MMVRLMKLNSEYHTVCCRVLCIIKIWLRAPSRNPIYFASFRMRVRFNVTDNRKGRSKGAFIESVSVFFYCLHISQHDISIKCWQTEKIIMKILEIHRSMTFGEILLHDTALVQSSPPHFFSGQKMQHHWMSVSASPVWVKHSVLL